MNNLRMNPKRSICRIAAALFLLPLFGSCDKQELPGNAPVPEGMIEVRPALPALFNALPRDASEVRSQATRTYAPNETTDADLKENKTIPLPEGSTVWLIAKNEKDNTLVKNSYVVHNSGGEDALSYLIPCTVNEKGEVIDEEGAPLYLKEGTQHLFYAVSPARELDQEKFAQGKVAFQVKNGAYFYANDGRYTSTSPEPIKVESTSPESVQRIPLNPMINQTALLRFQIKKGEGVHDLDIQPAGIQLSGLQNDSPDEADSKYGTSDGLFWHMSQAEDDEPILLQHGDKTGTYNYYNYTIDAEERVNIEVPVLPMRSLSKPVIVVFRLKVNGVPTSYEMMLNEKDFKAGYSYGYRGDVSITAGVTVFTWQYVSWELDVDFPFN